MLLQRRPKNLAVAPRLRSSGVMLARLPAAKPVRRGTRWVVGSLNASVKWVTPG